MHNLALVLPLKVVVPSKAEACYRQAIQGARQQHARSLELWAALDLGRLLPEQGRGQDGQQILATVYKGFTEGFDIPDLLSARTLLAHWSESDPMT